MECGKVVLVTAPDISPRRRGNVLRPQTNEHSEQEGKEQEEGKLKTKKILAFLCSF